MLRSLITAAALAAGALAMPISADIAEAGRGHGGHHGGGHHGWHGGHHGGGHHGFRRFGGIGFYGAPYFYGRWGRPYGYRYSSGYEGDCHWLLRRAERTGRRYWWRRYEACVDGW